MVHKLNFSQALEFLKMGFRVKRGNWDRNVWLRLNDTDGRRKTIIKERIPLLPDDTIVHWEPMIEEILADNWEAGPANDR